jgi:hypothetical protein
MHCLSPDAVPRASTAHQLRINLASTSHQPRINLASTAHRPNTNALTHEPYTRLAPHKPRANEKRLHLFLAQPLH